MKLRTLCILAPLAASLTAVPRANAQFGNILGRIEDKVEEKVEQKVEQKTDEAVDQAVDQALDPNSAEAKAKAKENNSANASSSTSNTTAAASLSSYSKFDFIPGTRVILYDDLSNTNVGDFPASWNTNGSGEVVTTNLAPGTWFKLKHDSHYELPSPGELPENFTLEFDVLHNHFYGWNLSISDVHGGSHVEDLYPGSQGFQIGFGSDQVSQHAWNTEEHLTTNYMDTKEMSTTGRPIHISIWRQGERVRLYVDSRKVFDLPRALAKSGKYNHFQINSQINENEDVLISNIRVAEGAPDTRSKLITDGKLSTTGITFAVNSDVISPQSAGVLKSIADVLKSNAGVKVRIVGHTDADGEAAKNLDLSKRRAASVKQALIKEYGIDEGRLTTDGMGSTQLVDKGTTPEAKANNRRVEFIKL